LTQYLLYFSVGKEQIWGRGYVLFPTRFGLWRTWHKCSCPQTIWTTTRVVRSQSFRQKHFGTQNAS